MTSMLGSGINYMPAAFKNSGILFGIISLSFFGTLTGLSILMILITAKIRASEGIGYDITYAKLGLEINKYLQSAIDICIFLTQFLQVLDFKSILQNL
ncbi:amino acid permease [Vairimorpha apis BRL 01]|uniref:Amino acid permease n=1 Tax=Vairimorpha apis BRL 01 TaxID=1037528 RepID=T0LDN8_9MICR|nr:amino acid permease [Vairimorpha apis BRL 01]